MLWKYSMSLHMCSDLNVPDMYVMKKYIVPREGEADFIAIFYII